MKLPAKLVAVHWTDAFDSDNGWINVKTYKPKPCHVVSVGFLWEDCLEGHVSITGSWFPEDESPTEADDVGMVSHIPAGMVNKIIYLPEPDFSSVSDSASGQAHPSGRHPTMPPSLALDYPPYAETVQRATSPRRARPR